MLNEEVYGIDITPEYQQAHKHRMVIQITLSTINGISAVNQGNWRHEKAAQVKYTAEQGFHLLRRSQISLGIVYLHLSHFHDTNRRQKPLDNTDQE